MLFVYHSYNTHSEGDFRYNNQNYKITLDFTPSNSYIIPGWDIKLTTPLNSDTIFIPHSTSLQRAFMLITKSLKNLCNNS